MNEEHSYSIFANQQLLPIIAYRIARENDYTTKNGCFYELQPKMVVNEKTLSITKSLFLFCYFQSLDARSRSEELFCGRAVAVLPAVEHIDVVTCREPQQVVQ